VFTGQPAGQGGSSEQGWFAAWGEAWDRFWFTPADPLPLAIVRIIAGTLLAWSCAVWLMDVDAFFGPHGWLRDGDVERMNDQPWQWSWFFALSSPTAVRALVLVTLVAAACLAVGLATPVAAWVALVGFLAAVNRTPLTVFGFDDALGMLLIPLAIGPAGAVLSLDRRLGIATSGDGPSVSANIALRLLQVHLCVVYFFSGIAKLFGASWWEGTALWGAAANSRYRTLDITWLARHPLLVNLLTLGTVFWEFSYPALVWPRLTRRLAIAMGIFVHLGIGLAMGMQEFGLAMIAANLAFVPAATWRWLLRDLHADRSCRD
jgi:uncharacterized membrane protein YphA (DoxX/SURF4 family)